MGEGSSRKAERRLGFSQGRWKEGHGGGGKGEGGRVGQCPLKADGMRRRAGQQNKDSFKRAKETLDGC